MDEAKAGNLEDAPQSEEELNTEESSSIDAEIARARSIMEDIERWERATPEERERASTYLLDLTVPLEEIRQIFDIEDEAEFKVAWEEWLNREE